MHPSPERLSLWETITLIFAIFRGAGNALFEFFFRFFRGDSGSASYRNHAILAFQRSLVNSLTVRQLIARHPSIDEVYTAFAKSQGFEPKDITLPSGTKAYWIGNPAASKVLIWFHGGGYNIPITPGHFQYINTLVHASSHRLSALVLGYTLAPHATYPTQLSQAIELLYHTLTTLNLPPSHVSIAGDSAGGNLTLAILSHLLHPHPEIKPLDLQQGNKLGAAILLSPWASFSLHWDSMRTNEKKDMIGLQGSLVWSNSFLGGRPRDAWNEPCEAEEGWWAGLEGVVGKILVVGGGDEVLVDCIRVIGGRLEAVHPDVETVIAPGEWHEKPVEMFLPSEGMCHDSIVDFVKKL